MEEAADKINPLEILPAELWEVVFEQVDNVKTLLKLRTVCGLFRTIIGTHGILRKWNMCVEFISQEIFDKVFAVFGWQGVMYHNLDIDADHQYKLWKNIINVHTLSVGCSKIKDVSMFGNIKVLDLSVTTNVTDVSALSKVTNLYLRSTDVVDVSMLGNVRILDLSDTDVVDVSMLGNVEMLYLWFCPMVTDVSALGKVKVLDLSGTNVTDVSALGNVTTLNLRHTNVTDVSALGAVTTLGLSFCYGVRDVSALGGVVELVLCCCINVKDVSALGDVSNLNLAGCVGVTDVSMLGRVTRLKLPDCEIDWECF